MPIELQAAHVLVASIMCVFCGCSLRQLALRNYHPLHLAQLCHCGFTLAPLFLEAALGPPTYKIFIFMRQVNESAETWVIYYLYVLATSFLFWYYSKSNDARSLSVDNAAAFARSGAFRSWHVEKMMYAGLAFPVVFALLSPAPSSWLKYGTILGLQGTSANEGYVNTLYASTYVAILAAASLIVLKRPRYFHLAAIIVFSSAAMWVNGKRNILLLGVVSLLTALRISSLMTKRVFIGVLTVAGVAFAVYSQWYQSSYRPTLAARDTSYEMLRMDYGRDSDIRMAIFAELHSGDVKILEYRGQTLLFDMLFFIPRSLWAEKPRPYYHYITSTALMEPPQIRTWGITTTILGEVIANLGWPGLLAGPYLIIVIAQFGYRLRDRIVTLVTGIICVLFLSIHIAGFTLVWTIWIAFVLRALSGRRRWGVVEAAQPGGGGRMVRRMA